MSNNPAGPLTTKSAAFGIAPAYPGGLLAVREGLPIDDALNYATCLISSAREQMGELIGQSESANVDQLHVMRAVLDQAQALVEACTLAEHRQGRMPSPA